MLWPFAGLAGLLASEAEIRRADHIMLAEPVTASLTGIVQTKAVRSSGRLSLTLAGLNSPDARVAALNKVRFSIGANKLSVLPGIRSAQGSGYFLCPRLRLPVARIMPATNSCPVCLPPDLPIRPIWLSRTQIKAGRCG